MTLKTISKWLNIYRLCHIWTVCSKSKVNVWSRTASLSTHETQDKMTDLVFGKGQPIYDNLCKIITCGGGEDWHLIKNVNKYLADYFRIQHPLIIASKLSLTSFPGRDRGYESKELSLIPCWIHQWVLCPCRDCYRSATNKEWRERLNITTDWLTLILYNYLPITSSVFYNFAWPPSQRGDKSIIRQIIASVWTYQLPAAVWVGIKPTIIPISQFLITSKLKFGIKL